MAVLLVVAILVAFGLLRVLRRDVDTDAQARIVSAAANHLPAHRRDWGQAMIAELAEIPGRARRWRFTLGVLRVAAFPPSGHHTRVLLVAVAGLLVAAAATVAAATEVPSLSMFVAALSLLLGGYATAATSRSPGPRWTASYAIVGALALAGVAATITTVVRVAAAHPTATADATHVFSILFALILTGYLALALAPLRPDDHADTLRWWAIAGALVSGTVWIVSALTDPVTVAGVTALISPAGAAATLVVSIGASAVTGNRRIGFRAGLLTAVLGAPILFAVDMTELLQVHQFTLTDPYDVAAYPHSGYPDVASYILSDAIGGHIIGGLVLYPIALLALALLGAAAGSGLQQLIPRHTST